MSSRPALFEVPEDFAGFRIADDGAHGHRDVQVLAAAAGTAVGRTPLAHLRAVGALNSKVGQRVDALGGAQQDAAAMTAITAVRAAKGHGFLAAKTGRSTPAIARLHPQICFINEFHPASLRPTPFYGAHKRKPRPAAGVVDEGTAFPAC